MMDCLLLRQSYYLLPFSFNLLLGSVIGYEPSLTIIALVPCCSSVIYLPLPLSILYIYIYSMSNLFPVTRIKITSKLFLITSPLIKIDLFMVLNARDP